MITNGLLAPAHTPFVVKEQVIRHADNGLYERSAVTCRIGQSPIFISPGGEEAQKREASNLI